MHAGFQGITVSLTIDGGQSVTATLPPPTPPSYQTPNVSLFDLQLLPSADHTATINLLDWENGTTSLYFDYALINESYVELASSTSTTSHAGTSTTLATPTTASSSTTLSTFVGSTYTSGATSAVSRSVPSHLNLSPVADTVYQREPWCCGGRRMRRTRCSHFHRHSYHLPQKAQVSSRQAGRKPQTGPIPRHPSSGPDSVVGSASPYG